MKRSVLSRRWFRAFLYVVLFGGLGTASWPLGQAALGWWNQRALRQAWDEQVRNERTREQTRKVQPGKVALTSGKSSSRAQLSHSQTDGQTAKLHTVKKASVKWPSVRLIIASIDVDAIVLSNVDDDALKKGPGHDPASSLPGQTGNCVLAAHRNAYGWWFYNLGELGDNARIELRTPATSYHYKVVSTQVLPEDATQVLQAPTDSKAAPRLTLYTCALPHGSHRIVVTAVYTGQKPTTS